MTPGDLRNVWDGAKEIGEEVHLWRPQEDWQGRNGDEDIVKTFTKGTESVAGAFEARGTFDVMRIIDCLGMDAARTRCASLNEFREIFGFMKYEIFEEWNPNGDH
ncbi:hypothetical protein JCM10908_000977 [Rhodotorula pacifica]|uniref:uncharacterized protein n=1 Tax=Rhodotorula pacifica TaxID=1495444 RepID=UPI00317A6014